MFEQQEKESCKNTQTNYMKPVVAIFRYLIEGLNNLIKKVIEQLP